MNIGALTATLGIDTKKFRSGLKNSMGQLQRFGRSARNSFRQVGSSIGRLFSPLKRLGSMFFSLQGAMFALGGALIGKHFLDTAASFEKMEIQLNKITGGRGKQKLNELKEWARELPVNTEKAVQAFVKMRNYGLKPTLDQMELLVDVSAVAGEEKMATVAEVMGRISAAGKVEQDQLNRLVDANVRYKETFMEAFGTINAQKITEMASEAEILNAIYESIDRNLGGMARETMDSWAGVMNRMQSAWTELELAIADAGVFDTIKGGIANVSDALMNWVMKQQMLKDQNMPNWIDRISNGFTTLYNTMGETLWAIWKSGILQNIGRGIKGIAGAVKDWLQEQLSLQKAGADNFFSKMADMFKVLGNVVRWVVDHIRMVGIAILVATGAHVITAINGVIHAFGLLGIKVLIVTGLVLGIGYASYSVYQNVQADFAGEPIRPNIFTWLLDDVLELEKEVDSFFDAISRGFQSAADRDREGTSKWLAGLGRGQYTKPVELGPGTTEKMGKTLSERFREIERQKRQREETAWGVGQVFGPGGYATAGGRGAPSGRGSGTGEYDRAMQNIAAQRQQLEDRTPPAFQTPLVNVESMQVREEADIERISRDLSNRMDRRLRGKGRPR